MMQIPISNNLPVVRFFVGAFLLMVFILGAAAPQVRAQQGEPIIAKNIAVLVDRSLSVDPENCREALALVARLIDGSMSADQQATWAFTSNTAETPERRNLKAILAAGRGKPLWEPGVTKVLTAGFGSRESIPKIPHWDAARTFANDSELSEMLEVEAGKKFTDKKTFYTLAKATIADRLRDSQTNLYYLFVVSDEHEDLTDCTVTQYRENWPGVVRKNNDWLIDPGYNRQEQDVIEYYNQKFDEKKLGSFHLKDPTRFRSVTREPVNVIVYATRNGKDVVDTRNSNQPPPPPKAALTFTSPAGTSTASPVTIADGRSQVKWQLKKGDAALPGPFTLRAESLDSPVPPVVREGVTATEMDLFASGTADAFPTPLGGGVFAITVEAVADGVPLNAVAYVRIDRGLPHFVFVEKSASLNESTTPASAHDFETDTEYPPDQGFLNIGFDWEAKPAPTDKHFAVEIIPVEEDGTPRRDAVMVGIKDCPVASFTIEELLKAQQTKTKPFQGLNELRVSGVWKDRGNDPITIVAYFRVPKPKLELLGRKLGGETPRQPRLMAGEGEVLKFQNRHHGWPGTQYEVRAFRVGKEEEEEALELEKGQALYQLSPHVKMDTIYKAGGNGTYKITIAYKTLKNSEAALSNELLAPPVAAYVTFHESKLLSRLLVGAGVLCVALFGWHFWSRPR